jgi:hypothetical protein
MAVLSILPIHLATQLVSMQVILDEHEGAGSGSRQQISTYTEK